jgi:hypothetical protein
MNEQLRHYFVFRWKLIHAGLWLPRTSLQFLAYHPSSDGDIMDDGTTHIIFPPWTCLNWAPLELVRLISGMGHLNSADFKKYGCGYFLFINILK